MNAEFFRPERVMVLIFFVLIIFLLVRNHQMRKVFWSLLQTTKSLDRSDAYKAPKNRRFKEILFMLGCLFAVVAFMRPRWGEKERIRRINGVDLCVALDLSNSMMAEDHSPNRLSFAKRELTLLLEQLSDTRVTLVGFSGGAFISAPLTSDLDAVSDLLSPLGPDFVSNPSTYLEGALLTCAESLGHKDIRENNDRDQSGDETAAGTILLVTDGEDSIEIDSDLIKVLRKKSLPVYSFLIGGKKPAQIPIRDVDGSLKSFLKNPATGAVVETTTVDKTVSLLAKETAAAVYKASEISDFAPSFAKELKRFESKSREEGVEIEKEDQFQIPLFFAFLFLLLELFVTETGTFLNRKKTKTALLALGLSASLGQAATAPRGPTVPNEPTLRQSLINNYGVFLANREFLNEAQRILEKNVEAVPNSEQFVYNWLSARLRKIAVDLHELQSKGKEFDAKNNPFTNEATEIVKIIEEYAAGELDEARQKEWKHQLAQALEFAGQTAPAIEAYYDSIKGIAWPDLDTVSKHNLARLLLQQSQSGGGGQQSQDGGGGGGGEGGQGKDGKAPSNQPQKPQDWKGQSFTPEQVKQIMQNVGSEERNVLKKKSRDEARKRTKEWGEGRRGNPW